MRIKALITCALLALIVLFHVSGVQGLQSPDSFDLLVIDFAAANSQADALAKVDTSTSEQALFYTTGDPDLQAMPLEWSPSGSLLAVALLDSHDLYNRDMPSWWMPVSMCIVRRDGTLYRCMAEPASPHILLWGENRTRDAFPVTWSSDERQIYYLTADIDDHERTTLIEADVDTGHMTRVLATYTSTDDNTPSISWPSDLRLFILGGLSWNPRDPILVDTATGTSTHLIEVDERIGLVCPRFSPDGRYFVTGSSEGGLLVFDQHVQTVAAIDPMVDGQYHSFDCPSWSADGRRLYFIGQTLFAEDAAAAIFRYSLAEHQLSVFAPVNIEGSVLAPGMVNESVIEVSPDGRRVALVLVKQYTYDLYVAVIDEHGAVQNIELGTDAPLWIPPATPSDMSEGNTTGATEHLIFEAGIDMADGDLAMPVVVRLETSSMSPQVFYRDEYAARGESLRPLAWSPHGNYLAVARVNAEEQNYVSAPSWWLDVQICVVTRTGQLLRCMEELAAPHFYSQYGGGVDANTLTWAADEGKLYYATANPARPDHLSLIESDVRTGQTLRTLFVNEDESSPQLTWTADRAVVVTGVSDPWPERVVIHSLSDGSVVSVTSAVRREVLWACSTLSPQNGYLSLVVDAAEAGRKLLILSLAGAVVREIEGGDLYPGLRAECPTWSADERSIYFDGYAPTDETASIFHFDMDTGILSVVHQWDGSDRREKAILSPLQLSPSGNSIAFTTAANPAPEGGYAVKVVSVDGGSSLFLSPYAFTAHPLWIPPR